MKQVLIRHGRVVVEEMREPSCEPRHVLVRSAYSLISPGTESASVKHSAPPPAGSRLRNRVGKIGEVVRMAMRRGLKETRSAVAARLEGPSYPTGYSLSGTVLEVGDAVTDLVPGQRVACAGSASAHHAEVVAVPRNLVVAVPEGLSLERAAGVTLGAIALQGVRQADVRLGEIVCVLGLGLVGQLTVSLLRASGCRVVGTDTDPLRVERARSLGLELGCVAGGDDETIEAVIERLTAGRGVDVALLTAATSGSELIRQSVGLIRRRGRVVVVGDVGMQIDRAAFYEKEAELRISCSYGPGRYDPRYEEQGQDYPYEYVRWTENRNMAEFLRLVDLGEVPIGEMIDRVFDIGDAAAAYRTLNAAADERPLGVLLRYDGARDEPPPAESRRIEIVPRTSAESGVGVGLLGPGSFAREIHLPNLASLAPTASLRAVAGRSSGSAREVARRHAAAYACTDPEEMLSDEEIDLVMICTRHDRHAELSARALLAGKAVFCEKPAALDLPGLLRLDEAVRSSGRPFTVGFNRRFAPDMLELKERLFRRQGPLVLDYRVNAGRLPTDHWLHGTEGGGRLIGEACHMVDLMGHLVGHPRTGHAIRVLAPPAGRGDLSLGDNFALTCRYADGSLATLVYTSLGDAALGKERAEAHWDGQSAVVDDFLRLTVHGHPAVSRSRDTADKGHRELLRRFVEHVAGHGPEPIPWHEILDVSRFVLDLDREIRGRVN